MTRAEISLAYRKRHPEKVRAAQRAYCARNPEKRRELNRNWICSNRDRYNASKAKYRLKLKYEVMRLYVDPVRCVCCGFSQIDGLVLDHINDNGAVHRKAIGVSHRSSSGGTRIYEYIWKTGKIDGLQVLCANCNTIKQLKFGRRKSIKDAAILAEIEALYAHPVTQ